MLLLFAIASIITGFVALCLIFFRATRKTYPGFGHWIAGVIILSVGYAFYALRGNIPLWSSVFLGTVAFPLGMLLHLDGLRRFLGLKPASGLWYVVPVVVLAGLALFYFHWDSSVWRTFVASTAITAIHWNMAAILGRSTDSTGSSFYRVIRSLLIIGGLLILARSLWLLSSPDPGLLWKAPLEFALFILFVVIHLGENLAMVMMNAERVERDLLEAQADLSRTVHTLQESLARQQATEDVLRDSEDRYRTFFQTSRDCVFMTTVDGRFVAFNDVALDMLGYEEHRRDEVLGMQVHDLYAHPEQREGHAALVKEIGFSKDYPVDLRKADGTVIHTLITTVARRDRHGNLIGFQGTVRDVTVQRQREEELKASHHRLDQIIAFLPDPTLVIDSKGRVEAWNLAMEDLTGIPARHMIGKDNYQYAVPLYGERRPILADLALTWDARYQDTFLSLTRHKDGILVSESFHHSLKGGVFLAGTARALYDAEGEPVAAIQTFRNVTDIKKAEKAVRESEEKYRTVVEESFEGVFVQKGKVITFANGRLHEMLGYAPGELEGMDHWSIYHPDYQEITRSRAQARLAGESPPQRYEVKLLHKDGTSFPGEINAKVILFDNEPGVQVWIRDLTEQKLMEKRLFEIQKMESIGTLTGGLAHDFNNLLTIINGFTEMVLLETPEDDPRHKDLQKVLETGQKGAELVERLLALSKKAESRPQPLHVNRMVEDAVAMVERTFPHKVTILTVLGHELGMVNVDFAKVEQVLVNLFINANEAMPEGGRLRIETRHTLIDEAYCREHLVAKPGPHVAIEISDTGAGMTKETMERMFDPFFTTKGWDSRKGTGLGLSVAKGIIEQHGGWITCQSRVGEGTTFSVFLPVVAHTQEAQSSEPAPPGGEDGARILLVDDEDLVRELGKRILERAGYSVITASNGKDALEIFAQDQANIGLVVLDLVMPQVGGETCLEELLKMNPHTKVIVSSGHSLDAMERDRLGSKAKGFVDKPYELKQLVRVIQGVMQKGNS